MNFVALIFVAVAIINKLIELQQELLLYKKPN